MLTIEFTRLDDGQIRAVVRGLEQEVLDIFEMDNREALVDQLGYTMIERMKEAWPIGEMK